MAASKCHSNNSKEKCYKVILLGDSGVGKTAIFNKFRNVQDDITSNATVNIESWSKSFTIDRINVKLTLWDTAGTERFRTITQNYYRNSAACILVCSMDEPSTLTNLGQWANDFESHAESALKIVVGNKIDCEKVINDEKLKEFARFCNSDYVINVSAKTGAGIDELFNRIASSLLNEEKSRVSSTKRLFDEDDKVITDLSSNSKNPFHSTSCCS